MARRGRSDSGPLRWLLVPLIPVGALFAYFSLFNYSSHRQYGTLVIEAEESAFYASFFDLRRTVLAPGSRVLERYELDALHDVGSGNGPCTYAGPSIIPCSFAAEGRVRTVEARRIRSADGGYLIKFPADDPFNGQRQIALFPVGASGMALKFGEVLAAEMGLIVPELSYVTLTVCGEDHGVHAKEERIGDTFFEKRQLTGFSLFEQGFDAGRPDHLFPNCEEDSMAAEVLRARLILAQQHDRSGSVDPSLLRMSDDQVIAWALMVWLEQREDMLCDEALFAYDRNTGNTFPLYRAPRMPVDPNVRQGYDLARHPLLLRIQDSALQQQLLLRLNELREEEWRLRERLHAALQAWGPLLGQGQQAVFTEQATAQLEARMERLRTGDPVAWFDRALVPPSGHAQYLKGQVPQDLYVPWQDHREELAAMAKRTKARVVGDSLVFGRGTYTVDGAWVFPLGATVVLERGARFEMGPGASVLCQGALRVRGTSLNPVFIRAAQDSAFGTFAVVGEGATACDVRGLRISGGSNSIVNGTAHSAMLSFHQVDLHMENCVIGGSRGEDALNVKNGKVSIMGCVFENGHADLVDLDLVTGTIDRCVFRSASQDRNGDGLDLSGSQVTVLRSEFRGLPDKGLSVGEGSQVFVQACTFLENILAIAVKDLSVAHVDGSIFRDNGLVFQVNRKKAIYGGAQLMVYTNTLVGNAQEREVDEHSRIVSEEEPSDEVREAFGIVPL